MIVGELDLFPTWMPEDNGGLFLVGNLDYIFDEAGYRLPYQVWMKVGPQFDHSAIESQVYSHLGVGLLSSRMPPAQSCPSSSSPSARAYLACCRLVLPPGRF